MAIVKCTGPMGEPGIQFRDETGGQDGECHVYVLGDDVSRRAAGRAAMRDANLVASKGDPRMARDG
jgi:hypothetical protein